jgi:hypothetical protein
LLGACRNEAGKRPADLKGERGERGVPPCLFGWNSVVGAFIVAAVRIFPGARRLVAGLAPVRPSFATRIIRVVAFTVTLDGLANNTGDNILRIGSVGAADETESSDSQGKRQRLDRHC